MQLGRRLFLQHSTAYRSSPEQLNEYFKTVLHNWDGYAGTELYLLLSFPAKNLDKGQSDISAVRCCVMYYYFLIWGATLGLVVELLPHWLWYPVCRSSSASACGPGEDLFQQTAKVLTLTSSYKESFHHKFDFVSNCDAHECLSSGAVIQAWDAHSWMALKAHQVGWSLLVSCSDNTVRLLADRWVTHLPMRYESSDTCRKSVSILEVEKNEAACKFPATENRPLTSHSFWHFLSPSVRALVS